MKLINKFLDVPKLIRRVWVILWITLFIFVIAKLCFNWWYPIVVENEIVVNICSWIDKHYIVYVIINFLFYLLNYNIVFLTNIKKLKYNNIKQLIIMNILYLIGCFIKLFSNPIGMIYEIIIVVLLPIIMNIKNKTFNIYRKNKFIKNIINIFLPISIYILLNIWQMNIMFVRGIKEVLTTLPILIFLVLQIDYYIYTFINWIGVNYFMGFGGLGWFWGKSETELLALKETELKKENPDSKLIAEIDKELEKRKNATKA